MAVQHATQDVQTDHEYDGIREFDNPMPRWWLLTLYGAIAFSFAYWFYYHTLEAGQSSMAAYQTEMAEAKALQDARASQVDEATLIALKSDPTAVEAGKAAFVQNCVACHSAQGEGLVGPNLTDAYWIHGANPEAIYTTVSKGVLTKGMPAWGEVLGPTAAQQLTAYVLTLQNTNVPGKAPEGVDANGNAPSLQ